MSIYNIIKGFFGFPDKQDHLRNRENFGDNETSNQFRKPIWNWEDDEDDDDVMDFRTQPPFGFKVFSSPVEIHRFFEHQMAEMMKMFQGFGTVPRFPQDGSMFGNEGTWFGMPSLPAPFTPSGGDPEDGKPGPGRSLRDYYLKPGYDVRPSHDAHQDKQDIDLDDRVKSGELSPILENLPGSSDLQPNMPRKSGWYRSVTTFSTVMPDGSVEEHRTVDNGNGKEETVTRRVGDKTYSVTTTTDVDGIQKRTERLINLDKDNVDEFEKTWSGSNIPELKSPPSGWFSFDKLFK